MRSVRLSGKKFPSGPGTSLAQLAPVQILWLKAGKLLPVDTGGKIRSFHLLRELSRRHEVTLLSYYGGAPDLEYERALVEVFPRAVAVSTRAAESPASMAFDYARKLPSGRPYAVAKFTARPVRRLVARWDAERRFDALVCDFLAASLNVPRGRRTPAVLFQHNVESILWRRQADAERHPIKRLVFGIEASRMARYERDAVRRFDRVIAVSEADRQAMGGMVSPDRISVVPTGVDAEAFRPMVRSASPAPIVLFLGSMDWEANIDGVQYFVDAVWPAIRTAVPGARFQIVGRNPSAAVRRLASADVEVVGTVPSVVEYLHQAAAVVVPLRIGGGTRLKIYEAMAAGKAVISTTIGAEGLDCRDGRDILIADAPGLFAERVVRVLQDPAWRRSIEDAAIELASRYDWSAVARVFEAALEHTIAAPPVRGAAEPGEEQAPQALAQ